MPGDRRLSRHFHVYEAIQRCLNSESLNGIGPRIGLAGGSGSGKSTVAALIRERLHPLPVNIIKLDRYFKPEEQLPKYYSQFHGEFRPDFNAPDSLHVEEMLASCRAICSSEIVIFDGHFALFYPEMRALMDLKCFVEADAEEMLERRTRRNMAVGYGGGLETISAYNRECVLPRFIEYILPTKQFADIVIPNGDSEGVERDEFIEALCNCIRSLHAPAA